jgi:large subunit ribosomal protein L31
VVSLMKKGIHPKYYHNAKVTCACGNSWVTGSTQEEIRTDLCSACHPFFTGEMRIVDTAGQVERFVKRLEKRSDMLDETASEITKKEAEGKGGKKIIYELVDDEPGHEVAVESAEEVAVEESES